MKNTSEESLGNLFTRILKSIDTGSGNTEALKKQFLNRSLSLGKSSGSKVRPSPPESSYKVKQKAKVKSSPKVKKVKSYKNSIENKIEVQRQTRNGGQVGVFGRKLEEATRNPGQPKMTLARFKAAISKKKEDLADKVERQRKRRKPRPKNKPTGAEGKDPKVVRSKKPPRFN